MSSYLVDAATPLRDVAPIDDPPGRLAGRSPSRPPTLRIPRSRTAMDLRHAPDTSRQPVPAFLQPRRTDDDRSTDDQAAPRRPTARVGDDMDAVTLLKRDHDKLKGLLKELEPTTERAVKTRTELFERVKYELTLHEIIEEEIFYPTLKQHPKAKEIVLEGYEEHGVVDTLMGELEALPVDDETWGAKAKVMIENIEHHIEEEEGEMFVKARQILDRQELEQLGEAMEQRKTEAMSQQAFAKPAS
jgi:hemerythrin-like domain-containing protein